MKLPVNVGMVAIALLLAACTPRPQPPPAPEPAAAAEIQTLSGWFHVVCAQEPLYFLVEEQGESTQLFLGADFSERYGDPRAFKRRSVRITGEVAGVSPRTLRVVSIDLEG